MATRSDSKASPSPSGTSAPWTACRSRRSRRLSRTQRSGRDHEVADAARAGRADQRHSDDRWDAYDDLDNPPDVVGAALEASRLHPDRSGRDHLRDYCTVAGSSDTRADETLQIVGLRDAARRPVRGSLGMRQRLGLATALLGDPPVLVRDEPANGLDPAGIAWLRRFLTPKRDVH